MDCKVVTGYAAGTATASTGDCIVASPGKKILFSPETIAGTVYSSPFTINPGQAVLIDAYNQVEDLYIYINRLVITSYCVTSGNACCAGDLSTAKGFSPIVSFRERLTLGNNPYRWTLYKPSDETAYARNQILLAIPGTYELELQDSSSQLGMLEVELQYMDMNKINVLPNEYFGGIN